MFWCEKRVVGGQLFESLFQSETHYKYIIRYRNVKSDSSLHYILYTLDFQYRSSEFNLSTIHTDLRQTVLSLGGFNEPSC